MKLAIVCPGSTAEGNKDQIAFDNFLERNMDLVKSPETEIHFLIPKAAMPSHCVESFISKYVLSLDTAGVVSGVVQAERDGYDAAIIYCGHDPALWEARQAVNIPVVGLCESAVMLAASMGAQFGVVAISPEAKHIVKDNILRYGLRDKLAGIRVIPATLEEQMLTFAHGSGTAWVERFRQVARELIADGAEVLITACGMLAPALRMAPGDKESPEGLNQVDGVPVVDMVSAAVKMAETLASLKKAGSPWISRKGFYAQPRPGAQKMANEVLEPALRQGVWRHDSHNVLP